MTWWNRLWQRKRLERDLEKELSFHLERHANDLIAQGQDPEEARRQARLAVGGPEQVKESCRDARGTRWLENLFQDLRYTVRTLRQRPGFTAVALLTLALGSGATTVMFTVASGVLLKPLAYPEPDRLVSLEERTEKYGNNWPFAYPNFLDCERASRTLEMAAWRWGGGVAISEKGEAEYVNGREVSADFFSVLRIPLLRGRAFLASEDRTGGTPVAIISSRLWKSRYGGNARAVGGRLIFGGKFYTIVGITPPGFRFSGDVDVFTPLGQNTMPVMNNREMHPGISVIGRLRPEATLAQAQAELGLIGRRLAEQYPKSNAGRSIGAGPLREKIVGDVRPTLWLLLGAVSMVLVIACVNVASLLLARAVSRERELAMRVALGAGRGRLVRQCLTESAVLGLCGGVLGVLLAALGIRPFLMLWPGGLPRSEEVGLDWRVLVFALAVSLLSGLLFGIAPAMRAPRHDVERILRAGARTVTGSSRRLHSGFVISEISIAVVLLIAAGMLGRMLLRVSYLDPGIDPHNVLVMTVSLSSQTVTNPAHIRGAFAELLDRVRQTPGVQSAALADLIPMGNNDDEIGYWTTPAPPRADQMPVALLNLVTPDYLRVMRIPLLQGRSFTDKDVTGNETVIAIDEVLAKRVFGGRDAIGKILRLQILGPARVVGVVGHVRHWGLDADDTAKIREQIYLPFAQLPDPFVRLMAAGTALVVRTNSAPMNMSDAVRRQVRGATPDQVSYNVRTMEEIVSGTLARQRFLLVLFGIFGALALLLACIGIYGVLAYLTSQRVPEVGVRMALGASPGNVLGLVLRGSLGMILIGAGLGAVLSIGAASLLKKFVEGVRPMDPITFGIMISALMAAALLAAYVPARRASRIDPVSALRED